jgi:uncharacterized RDD family membrane protein YckC
VILWTTSLPIAIENGAALGGYVAAIIVIGIGTGGIKSNIAVSPLSDISLANYAYVFSLSSPTNTPAKRWLCLRIPRPASV